MPQVDLETLVSACAGADRKIACETLAGGEGEKRMKEEEEDLPPDFPPESFWLSKDAEFDWFDRNAFYERKDSTKGASNSSNLNSSSNSSSQRFSKNFKARVAIIGLQKTSYVDTTKRRNCRPPNIRLFPKRSESVGKSAAPMTEPSSPKVSCMGRVRSKRCRRKASEATRPTTARNFERRRSGLFGSCMSVFQSRRGNKPAVRTDDPPATTVESLPRRHVTAKAQEFPESVKPAAEPPSLGGMKRFASGRRSTSWGSDSDVSKGHS